jgi:sulfur carrier protein ThiS
MEVTLHLFATLSRYMPKKAKDSSCTIELDEGTRVRDLLEGLKIPAEKVKL